MTDSVYQRVHGFDLAGSRRRIPLPLSATVTVDESLSDGRQHVDVRLRAPILSEWFRYAGSFTYRYEAR